MRFGVDVKLPDFSRLRVEEKDLDRFLGEAAAEAERRAKLHAPVDTGRLRSSVEAVRDAPLRHGVKTNVQYAAFQEFGTGPPGRASDPGPTPSDYVHGPGPGGVRSRPFLRPAMFEVRALLKSLFAKRKG